MPITITPNIVAVNTTVTSAPQPSQLQRSGPVVSVGGTTLSVGTYAYYGTLADAKAVVGTLGNYLEVGDMLTSFFAQGSATGVYILELGVVASASAGITALSNWISANPNVFYAYLTPATWDTDAADLNTLAATYSSPTGRTYFAVTTSQATISGYAATSKAIIATVDSPTAASTEFQAAVPFYQLLANNPSVSAPAAPMNFRYAFGVTPYSLLGNATNIDDILTAHGNVILTGAEGGISTAVLRNGTTMDGNPAMFWYAVDWISLQAKQQLAAAIINGSNQNPPLYYNQFGINALEAVLQNLGNDAIAYGLLVSATFTATPFATYIAANPSDYAAGIYSGFSATVTPQNGFTSITFNLDAVQF